MLEQNDLPDVTDLLLLLAVIAAIVVAFAALFVTIIVIVLYTCLVKHGLESFTRSMFEPAGAGGNFDQ